MAYAEYTKVPFERTVNEIAQLIKKAGGGQIAQAEDEEAGFFAIAFRLDSRLIRFRIALADENSRHPPDRLRRQRGRALLLVIKGKIESVETGIETTEEAFLANIVMADGLTVYERIAEPIAIEYQTGRPNATAGLLPPPGAA